MISKLSRYLKEFEPAIFAFVLLAIWIIGAVGFIQIFNKPINLYVFLDALYLSVQLFILNSSNLSADHFSPYLEIARWAAPTSLAYATVRAAFVLLHDHINKFRLQFLNNHIIVCGLGEKGFQFASSIKKSGDVHRHLVIIESDANNSYIDDVKKWPNTIIVIGDASDNSTLERSRVTYASKLVAFTSADKTNLAIAQTAFQLKSECSSLNPKLQNPLECRIHIYDNQLRQLFSDHPLFVHSHHNYDARLFSVYETGAKRLLLSHFKTHQLNVFSSLDTVRDHHILLIGFGWIGKNLALQAARTGCYPDHRRLRVTVIDHQAEYLCQKLFLEMPAITQLLDIRFYQINAELLPPSLSELNKFNYYLPGNSSQNISEDHITKPDVTFVSLGDELLNFTVAKNLTTWLERFEEKSEIVVCLSEAIGISKLIESAVIGKQKVRIIPTELLKHSSSHEQIFNDQLEKLAEIIHHDYVVSQLKGISPREIDEYCEQNNSDKANLTKHLGQLISDFDAGIKQHPARQSLKIFATILNNVENIVPWSELKHNIQETNREQANHISIKLGLIDCKTAFINTKKSIEYTLTEEEIEVLAKVEHSRWIADKILQGWKYGEIKNEALKERPEIKPYDELDQSNKDKDIATITNIPRLLKVNDQVITKI